MPTAPIAHHRDKVSGLLSYLAASPSPYHAAAEAAALLDDVGFRRIDETAAWAADSGGHYVTRGGALVAWYQAAAPEPTIPFRIVGAHTDSPNLRVKPRPDTGSAGWRQIAVEVYGGALLNSWLDRDLGLSGRIVVADGSVALTRVDRPLLRVAQLAIHLDREVNERGVLLDKQAHLTPLWGVGPVHDGDFAEFVAATIGVDAGDLVSWDLMLHDLTPPSRLGRDDDLIASARIDNLYSAWCAVDALVEAATAGESGPTIPVVALFDHEEVGSESTTGAGGPLLESVLHRIVHAAGGDLDAFHRTMARSACASADMAHAVHPNYSERHEPAHRPLPNAGPVIKRNSNQRYATDALTGAVFVRACEQAGVPHQVFVSRNNMPCGSTIGPITATRLGIPTVDVGCAQLSMHSARELAGAADVELYVRALHAFLRPA